MLAPAVFDHFFNNLFPVSTGVFHPEFQVHDTGDSIELEIEMPGFSQKDILLEMRDEKMSVSATTTKRGKETKIRRSFLVPPNIDRDLAQAVYESGVLTIRLPKKSAASPRRIEIKTPLRSS